jgi:hypothetical protein
MPPTMTLCPTLQEDGFTNVGQCSLDRDSHLNLVTTFARLTAKGLPPYGADDSAEALLREHTSRPLLVSGRDNELIGHYSSEGRLIAPTIRALDSDLTSFNASSKREIARHYSSGAGTSREPIDSDLHNLVSTHHQDLVIKKGR